MLAEQSVYPNNYTDSMVYIEKSDDYELEGVMLHDASRQSYRFKNLLELMKIYEQIFNLSKFPQATHKLRVMSDENQNANNLKDISHMKENIFNETIQRGDKPTFIIKVQYRQNTSWQGTIKWVENDVEKTFRSTLELIRLMDSAIEKDEEELKW